MLIKMSAFLASWHHSSLRCNQTPCLILGKGIQIVAELTSVVGFNQNHIQASSSHVGIFCKH